ncbi:Golgi apparatus membrane protein-like protein ECHIDNA [Hibiscus syriacus]|uniref:Golgi apparatus membrane protein-like protein ECHIDNA n=1 Tax=Hibiscus syriacus TaxID=106335 RepID=UPI00192224CD|nr:Golgi apparatus membrane protein-like protein ECHIDNA [Hibiscus syriacus]
MPTPKHASSTCSSRLQLWHFTSFRHSLPIVFVIIFVVTVVLAALDFWVVKNISDRILVGLRWWNEINEKSESMWRFECLDQESLARINQKDSWLFWWTLYLNATSPSPTSSDLPNVVKVQDFRHFRS